MALPDRPDATVVCTAVSRRFRTAVSEVIALDAVDLSAVAGELTVVAGPSGSGKSTLLAQVACLDRPDSGTVRVGDRVVTGLGRRARRLVRRHAVAMVLPAPSENLFDHLTVEQNLRWMATRAGRELDAAAALAPFGLADRTGAHVRDLSGGEQQRVAIAVALAGRAGVLVADEPTASLDRASAADVVAALRAAAGLGATVLVATHDHDLIDAADHVLHLDHGRAVP